MASIHKRKGSNCWYCAFRDADGHQVYRSTKQTDRHAAVEVCLGFERVARLAKQDRATISQVKRVVASILDGVGVKTVNYTIRSWAQSWIENKAQSKAPGTVSRYRGLIDSFLEFIGNDADRDLEMLSMDHIRRFRDARIKAGISPASANLALKTLRALLSTAVAQGHLTHNPATAVEVLPRGRRTRETFSQTQMRRLLAAADIEWQGMILVGYYVGARIGTCAHLQFEDIDFKERTITFTPEKQQRSKDPISITVPLHRDLMSYLENLRGTTGPIFPKLSQLRTGGMTGLSLSFRALLEKAGVNSSVKTAKGEGRKVYSLSFHSLRHSFNSDLAAANVSQEIRRQLIGHASDEVNDLYTHLELSNLRKAISSLPSLSNSPLDKN